MFAIYIRTDKLYDFIPHSTAWSYWTVNRDRRSFLFATNGKDEFSFHTQLHADEHEEDITDAGAKAMIDSPGRCCAPGRQPDLTYRVRDRRALTPPPQRFFHPYYTRFI